MTLAHGMLTVVGLVGSTWATVGAVVSSVFTLAHGYVYGSWLGRVKVGNVGAVVSSVFTMAKACAC